MLEWQPWQGRGTEQPSPGCGWVRGLVTGRKKYCLHCWNCQIQGLETTCRKKIQNIISHDITPTASGVGAGVRLPTQLSSCSTRREGVEGNKIRGDEIRKKKLCSKSYADNLLSSGKYAHSGRSRLQICCALKNDAHPGALLQQ